MNKVLVVFYSRTGTTKKIGEAIAQNIEGDVEEIISVKPRNGFLGFLRCGFEASSKKQTKIKEIKKDPGSYDTIIIGTPVWGGTMSSPIRTYLSKYQGRFKKIALFSTSSSGQSGTLKEMEDVINKKPVAALELSTKDVRQDRFIEKIIGFTETIAH